MVNLHTACVLSAYRGHFTDDNFILAIGSIRKKDLSNLCAIQYGEEFAFSAAKLIKSRIIYKPGLAGFAQSLRQAFLRRLRINSIVAPYGMFGIFVFLEELNTDASNIKLAITNNTIPQLEQVASDYFIRRKIA
jgi:hypothetical protein